jgi:glycosyltransferase involved in cell wall biosynthesis
LRFTIIIVSRKENMPPKVSVIVPCYNEQFTIRPLLEALHSQTFPRAAMEVVIADGMSLDGTRDEIARFQKDFPDLEVRLVDNLARTIPAGLNCAIAASRGEFIVRLDAHSKPYPDYVEICIQAHEAGRGDNVGGVWERTKLDGKINCCCCCTSSRGGGRDVSPCRFGFGSGHGSIWFVSTHFD